jgi:hypothetical protein
MQNEAVAFTDIIWNCVKKVQEVLVITDGVVGLKMKYKGFTFAQ